MASISAQKLLPSALQLAFCIIAHSLNNTSVSPDLLAALLMNEETPTLPRIRNVFGRDTFHVPSNAQLSVCVVSQTQRSALTLINHDVF